MDSRIREALKKIEELGIHDTLEGRSIIDGSVIPSQHIVTKSSKLAREVLALLTAEPEPCIEGEAYQVATKIGVLFLEYAKAQEALCDPRDEVAKIISAYASQVADKRAEELRAQVETLANKIETIVPYVLATINNSKIGDKSEWFSIHAGRAHSSRVQLENLRIKAREAITATEPKP